MLDLGCSLPLSTQPWSRSSKNELQSQPITPASNTLIYISLPFFLFCIAFFPSSIAFSAFQQGVDICFSLFFLLCCLLELRWLLLCTIILQHKPMVLYWSLSDSNSLLVSRTLLSILTYENSTVVWIVSIHPLFSNYSSHFSKPLGTIPSVPFTLGKTITLITLIVHNILSSLSRSKYMSLVLFSLILLCGPLVGKIHYTSSFFFINYH